MSIIKQENVDVCRTKVSFSFDKDKINSITDDIANDFIKNNKVSGFRKGKAPLDAVKLSERKYILDVAKQKLMMEAYEDIMFTNNWKGFGQPVVNNVNIDYSNFSVEFVIGYMPTFEIQKIKNIPDTSFVVEKLKEKLCEEHGTQTPFTEDDFLLNGDTCVVSYDSFIDGQSFEGSKAENVLLTIGSNKSIEGFEDSLVGMRPGENRSFNITIKEDFPNSSLANKVVEFNVNLLSASRKAPSEYNIDLAKTLGFETLEALEEQILNQAVVQVENYIYMSSKSQILTKLLESNVIDIPIWMLVDVAKQISSLNKLDWATVDDNVRSALLSEAKDRIKLTFIFEKIKELEPETVLSTEELYGILNSNINSFHPNVVKELKEGTNAALFNQVFVEIQDDYITRWLVKNSKTVEESVNA